ncbi:DUF6461 domain-containing protein [Actinoplanes sp. NPDC023714]|uniref:DUF6461 domain-containing protein n=1 Tax=Actinoplanes sp. NPDC023714 TaxID=3154322 RepID=UPI0033D51B12
MVAVSADDYAWFTEQYAELAGGCYLTLVRGGTPAPLIEQLAATNPVRAVGVRRLASFPGPAVAATALDGWTLLFTPAPVNARRLSRGTVLVSHAAGTFLWARDGEIVLEFDPADATRRAGTDPDALIGMLETLGFTTTPDEDEGGWEDDVLHRERSLALAEHLTGFRLTAEALEATTFTCATLPAAGEAARSGAGVSGETVRSGAEAGGETIRGAEAGRETVRSGAEAGRTAARPAAKAERWDEEYDAPDDDWSDADSDDDGDTDHDEREWPRLIAKVRRVFG